MPGIAAPAPFRLAGADRYATAAAVADVTYTPGDSITIVNGESFPDGLASAIFGGTILLVDNDSGPAATSGMA